MLNLLTKNALLASSLFCVSALSLAATTIDFTSGEGFSNGTIGGQQSWSAYGFDNGGAEFTVDTSGSGAFVWDKDGTTSIGAVQRIFSAAETGHVFNNADTTVTWDFTIDSLDATGAFNTGFEFYLGGFGGSGSDITAQFRGDGLLQINAGALAGNDRIVSGDLQNGETITFEIDYVNDTFTASRSTVAGNMLSLNGTNFIDVGFSHNSANPYELRAQTNGQTGGIGADPFKLDSISIVAVPEPSTILLVAGAFGVMIATRLRRRT